MGTRNVLILPRALDSRVIRYHGLESDCSSLAATMLHAGNDSVVEQEDGHRETPTRAMQACF